MLPYFSNKTYVIYIHVEDPNANKIPIVFIIREVAKQFSSVPY